MTSERNVWVGLALLLVLGCGDDDAVGHDAGEHDAGEHDAGEQDAAITNAANNPFPCLNPVPSVSPGEYLCDNGLSIRPQPITCSASENPNDDECTRDADCGATRRCNCATPGIQNNNVCLARQEPDCRSDQDCTPGFHCAHVIIGWSDWAIYHMRCQQPVDECATADDCLHGLDAGSVPMSYLACQANDSGRYCDLNGS